MLPDPNTQRDDMRGVSLGGIIIRLKKTAVPHSGD